MKETMTLKEIAELVGISERGLRKRVTDYFEKPESERSPEQDSYFYRISEKLNTAYKTKKPAEFNLDEVIAIVRAGGNELLANLLLENAISKNSLPVKNEKVSINTEIITQAVSLGVEMAFKRLLPQIERVVKQVQSPLAVLPVPASLEDEYVIPTQLGKMFNPPISAYQVNLLLAERGFQYRAGNEWIASEKGRKYSQAFPVSLSDGRIKYQLYWKRGILKELTNG